MDVRTYIGALGFVPKDGTNGVYQKIYTTQNNYTIEVDFNKRHIDYGDKITAESRTTQNFSQPENFVVLECIDKLLQKGYAPQNIILEKTWPSGHGTSGRLDICVNRNDRSPYLLIECKTYGKEFNKELARIHKDGGQLFTYFQLSGCKADVLMLYASEFKSNNFICTNEIIKIEDEYRSGEVKDIYEKWNKLTKDNGIFDSWVQPYNFQSKALTKEQLKEIKAEDSSFIFNRFLEILRHNVVSDKGNAFNKIFTLFLCKVYDETTAKSGEELKFQWLEGRDNHIDFQLRLTDLYSKGMKKFLDRTVSDFNDKDFEKRCVNLTEETKQYLRREVNKLRLEKNNEFAIKEVYDSASFEENAKVVKEVVELIQGYRIRYNKRQQYLSDFFELLLTTGLKQEAGQFFTPVPIAQFIIKSLPLDSIVADKLKREDGEILPYMIDYAAGSGHFITEYMHEVQSLLNACNKSQYIDETQTSIDTWRKDHFCWATKYVYGVEKDYRLVKVGKVGCYLHGDGLANVILSDGLANFHKNTEYKGKLRKEVDDKQNDNQQFDVLLSNPPYSVSSFRQTTRDYYTEKDFELYNSLTDNSSEIECLFVERTKQLLKEGGVAGVILPSSILSNAGIYTKAREVILRYFDIVAIAELGKNTFMETGTRTAVWFLRRRDNYFAANTKKAVDTYFRTINDVTINGIETPATKYVAHAWEGLEYSDYVTLLQKSPNDKVKAHDIFIEYKKKIPAKTDVKFLETLLNIEAEKLLYFILAYPQQVVVIKRNEEKDIEKRFLGYEFSNRRGDEGIHAIRRGKNIDECTQLFDPNNYDNPDKASTYIYRAFNGDYNSEIAESMQSHVCQLALIDMITFDRAVFDKVISTTAKKKVTFQSRWQLKTIESIAESIETGSRPIGGVKNNQRGILSLGGEHIDNVSGRLNLSAPKYVDEKFFDKATSGLIKDNDILLCKDGALTGKIALVRDELHDQKAMVNEHVFIIRSKNIITQKYLFHTLYSNMGQSILKDNVTGSAQGGLSANNLRSIRLPFPPKEIQEKIVEEINPIEEKEQFAIQTINALSTQIQTLFETAQKKANQSFRLSNQDRFKLSIGKRVLSSDLTKNAGIPVISANVMEPFGLIDKYLLTDFSKPSIVWGIDGDWMVNYIPSNEPFYPTDHCGVLQVLTEDILPKYLVEVLKQAGKEKGFCRSLRASIDRIAGLSIMLPDRKTQEEVVSQIEDIEAGIKSAREIVERAASQKQAVLDKYL